MCDLRDSKIALQRPALSLMGKATQFREAMKYMRTLHDEVQLAVSKELARGFGKVVEDCDDGVPMPSPSPDSSRAASPVLERAPAPATAQAPMPTAATARRKKSTPCPST